MNTVSRTGSGTPAHLTPHGSAVQPDTVPRTGRKAPTENKMQIKKILTAAGLAAMLVGGGTVAANAETYHGGYGYHDSDRGDRGDRHSRDDRRFRDDHRHFDRDHRHFHRFGFTRF